MWGTPEDIVGECNAHLYLGDDYGDNHCTIRCSLPEGHGEEHKEEFSRGGRPVVVTWFVDERADEDED